MTEITEKISLDEFKENYEIRGRKIVEKTNRKNKFNASKITIDGITFDSKLESECYLRLKLLQRFKRIKSFERQYKVDLGITTSKKRKRSHRIDFKVILPSGKELFVDAKGYDARDGQWRRDICRGRGIEINLVKSTSELENLIIEKGA